MTTWRYIKGSEKDFEGAPEWATLLMDCYGHRIFEEHSPAVKDVSRYKVITNKNEAVYDISCEPFGNVIAQRERVTSVNDDRLARDFGVDELIAERGSKYHREIKTGVWVDVYDVLMAWSVTNPALQHLIKKALQPGERGHKDVEQDLLDILHSARRAIELNGVNK